MGVRIPPQAPMKSKCCQQNKEFYVGIHALELLVGVARMPEAYRKARKDQMLVYENVLNCQCFNVLKKLLFVPVQLDKGETSLYETVNRLAKGKDKCIK